MHFWFDHPIQIRNKMIRRIIGLPMLKNANTSKNIGQVELTKRTLIELDGRGMKLNGVTNMEIKFDIHVISHKIYNIEGGEE